MITLPHSVIGTTGEVRVTILDAIVTGLFAGAVSVVGNYFGNKYLLKHVVRAEEKVLNMREQKGVVEFRRRVERFKRRLR